MKLMGGNCKVVKFDSLRKITFESLKLQHNGLLRRWCAPYDHLWYDLGESISEMDEILCLMIFRNTLNQEF